MKAILENDRTTNVLLSVIAVCSFVIAVSQFLLVVAHAR